MSVSMARQQYIPFAEDHKVTLGGLAGVTEAYRGRIRLVIGGREHTWPCDFVSSPAHLGHPGRELPPVLGRAGFLDEYAISVDSGYLIITRLGPIRRSLRKWMHRFGG